MNLLLTFYIYSLTSSICADDLYSKFHQTDYKIEFQRAELVSYEKSVWNIFDIKTFKFNRSTPLVNTTFNAKKDLSTGIEVTVQVYKFLSNEYRIFPLRFLVNFCRSLKENLGGSANYYKCGNFTTCEILKGVTYSICNFHIDASRFPPFMPNGEFRIRHEFTNYDEKLMTSDCFVKIYRPVPIKDKR